MAMATNLVQDNREIKGEHPTEVGCRSLGQAVDGNSE